VDNEDEMNQFLTFTVSEESYALKVLNVREVLEFINITKVPKMPDFMRGIINLRGSIVPVIDLKLKFGLGKTEKSIDSSVIVCELVIEDKTIIMGLLTDSVQEVISLENNSIEPTPYIGAKIDTSFIEGMGKKGEDFIIILNMNKILSSNEISDIADKVLHEEN
jgi:purine-binding chemotaxis protein CheW